MNVPNKYNEVKLWYRYNCMLIVLLKFSLPLKKDEKKLHRSHSQTIKMCMGNNKNELLQKLL